MTEKKGYQSWTISDELWEAVKEAISKKERDAKKHTKISRDRAGNRWMPEKHWGESSMFSGQDVNGKPFPKSMVLAVQFIVIFKNGAKLVFLRRSGVVSQKS